MKLLLIRPVALAESEGCSKRVIMGTCPMQVDIARHRAGRDIVASVREIGRPERTGKTPAHLNQPEPGRSR